MTGTVSESAPVRIAVALGPRSYEVVVGRGARRMVPELLPASARRAAVVTQARVAAHWGVDTGLEQETFEIRDGEEAKDLTTIEGLCRGFARFGLTRGDVVVAMGGGVVTDAAGFAAAVYHRGVAVCHVATTLLAQVDAAIGGKTGVNLPEGKNLVGAFWQPCAVVCDTETLGTLGDSELRNGHGEMAKYYFLGTDVVGADPPAPIEQQVAASVRTKVDHIVGDETDQGGRRGLLNYGHTLGHALETQGGYRLGHGEAVSIGMAFAARLAQALGRIDDSRVGDHDRLLDSRGLPRHLPAGADPGLLVQLMARDKKALSGITFVLDGPRGPEVVSGVDPDQVVQVLREMATR